MAFRGPGVVVADEREQRPPTGAAEDDDELPSVLKRLVEEAGLTVGDLGKQRRTASGRTYTLHARQDDIPFVNDLVNLCGHDVHLCSREHGLEPAVVVRGAAGRALVPVRSEPALLATSPGRVDVARKEGGGSGGNGGEPCVTSVHMDAPDEQGSSKISLGEGADRQVRNRWQASVTVDVREPRRITGFAEPLPRIDRFQCAGVLVEPEVAEALERATAERRLHHLVRRVDTQREDNEDEEEPVEQELPRVPVYSYHEGVLVRYEAEF